MYSNYSGGGSGWASVAKIAIVVGALFTAVTWLEAGIGREYTTLVIFALIGVILFALGGIFAYSVQRITLDAVTRFNQGDATTDRYRQLTFKELLKGNTAEVRADAALRVLDAKRIDQLAQQRAKLLTSTELPSEDDFWTVSDMKEEFPVLE